MKTLLLQVGVCSMLLSCSFSYAFDSSGSDSKVITSDLIKFQKKNKNKDENEKHFNNLREVLPDLYLTIMKNKKEIPCDSIIKDLYVKVNEIELSTMDKNKSEASKIIVEEFTNLKTTLIKLNVELSKINDENDMANYVTINDFLKDIFPNIKNIEPKLENDMQIKFKKIYEEYSIREIEAWLKENGDETLKKIFPRHEKEELDDFKNIIDTSSKYYSKGLTQEDINDIEGYTLLTIIIKKMDKYKALFEVLITKILESRKEIKEEINIYKYMQEEFGSNNTTDNDNNN